MGSNTGEREMGQLREVGRGKDESRLTRRVRSRRIKVGGGSNSDEPSESGSEIGENIGMQIRCHDGVERLGILDHTDRHSVDLSEKNNERLVSSRTSPFLPALHNGTTHRAYARA